MKNFIFLKTTIKFEENSIIRMIRIGNKVISIISITGNREYNHQMINFIITVII